MSGRIAASIALILIVASTVAYFSSIGTNPPGFHLDESSVAYNALTIARSGLDEDGRPFPLYFPAFGEYKNPTYVYALSLLFRLTPPSNLVPRLFSAVCGYAAAGLLALVAWRMAHSAFVALITGMTALFTPMLFEISRIAFEVSLYPLLLAIFVLLARIAYERERWSLVLVSGLALSLASLTYTYSIGRLLGPLLAGSLLLFATRQRRAALAAIGLGYLIIAVIPIASFHFCNDRALTRHFHSMTYVRLDAPIETLAEFEKNYALNVLPLGFSLRGDPNPRHHVAEGGGSILLATFVLAAIALWSMLRDPYDRWSAFLIIGALMAAIPASLTTDRYHTLRLVALPLFLVLLGVRALDALRQQPVWLAAVLLAAMIQAGFFLTQFHRYGGARELVFDVGIEEVMRQAVLRPSRPIYLDTSGLYIHAYWYGSRYGAQPSDFSIGPPEKAPRGALVITVEPPPEDSIVISRHGTYSAYQVP